MNTVLSVSQLNRYVKALLEENVLLRDIVVRGEISNLTVHRTSGHMYFSLKDKDASARAVMFRSWAGQLRFDVKNGMSVIARCQVSLYERDGAYQLYVRELQPDGVGALYLAYEQLKLKLAAEGLFDEGRKKSLPRFPRAIGIVTSETGAAVQDILSVLGKRWPVARAVLCPALVQGDGAPASLVLALETLVSRGNCDVIIIGRGGGGIEDLWAFNDEGLARAVAASPIPVISGVGHETDYTICDFAADLRAPTPTAAAQLAVPDISELKYRLYSLGERSAGSLSGLLARNKARLRSASARLGPDTPRALICLKKRRLSELQGALVSGAGAAVANRRRRLAELSRFIGSLSVQSALDRGYSVTRSGGRVITGADMVEKGDELVTLLRDGEIISRVTDISLPAPERAAANTKNSGE